MSLSQPTRPFVLSLLTTALLGLSLGNAAAGPDDACAIQPPQLPADKTAADAPVEMEADAATYQPDTGHTLFEGNAQLTQPGRRLQAERLRYLRDQERVEAEGDVQLEQADMILGGDRASYKPNTREGELEGARYAVPSRAIRGTAAKAQLEAGNRVTLEQPTYTTCPTDDPAWQLKADSIVLDQTTGRGTAKGASLQLGGVSLPGLPTLTFPIDDKRHSGVLLPTIGFNKTNGLDLTVPYYFNLAPNYDFTLSPRLLSKRGLAIGGEFRYLTPDWAGTVEAEILPSDRLYTGDGPRGSLSWLSTGRVFDGWRANLNINWASDDTYLSDVGSSFETVASRYLERTAELTHLSERSAYTLRVQHFQSIDPAVAPANRPYSRLPQLLGHVEYPLGGMATLSLDGEYVRFEHSAALTGQRIDLQPRLGLRWENDWAYVAPTLGGRYTGYQLSDDTSPKRTTHSLSLDAGMFFERPVSFGGQGFTQTLEPRLYYLYVPHEDQSALPVFDTALYDFSFDNLFRDNRFNGADRVGDANQLTLAVSSRFLEQRSGRERLRIGVGQIFYFDDRDVILPGGSVETSGESAFVAGLSAVINPQWRLDSAVQWDWDNAQVEQSLLRLGWDDSKGHRLHAGYRKRLGETEQVDIAGSWRLSARTSLIGRWTYSLRRQESIDALAGIEYGSCCWKLRTLLQRSVGVNGSAPETSIQLQLELRGLGQLGKNIDALMSDGLAGYRPGTIE